MLTVYHDDFYCYFSYMSLIFLSIVEFKGHQLLEAAKLCDSTKLKKHITPEIINFQHPLTLESSLVCMASVAKSGMLLLLYQILLHNLG